MSRKIKTVCVYPPIPTRDFDWCAYIDGDEESGRYGYGKTEAEAEAEADFIELWGDEYEAEDAAQREREREANHNGGLSPLGNALMELDARESK